MCVTKFTWLTRKGESKQLFGSLGGVGELFVSLGEGVSIRSSGFGSFSVLTSIFLKYFGI